LTTSVKDTEIQLFLEGIRLRYGYDFHGYARASMNRRVEALSCQLGAESPLDILKSVLHDQDEFQKILPELTVTTSEMFRDPHVYKTMREEVIPYLRTFPTVNVWSAGCSTGEEVFSLAILLQEAGLGDRSVIYATDINTRALKRAQDGIYKTEVIKTSTRNYAASGGKESFSRYYTADYGLVKMDSDLLSNVVFGDHSLVSDSSFAECHLILCRNVLIYFNKSLQNRALELFYESLRHGGILVLGSKESLRFSSVAEHFEPVDEKCRIFRKKSHLGPGKRGMDA
jgi:chemotaxis protein methyltransferase CheR